MPKTTQPLRLVRGPDKIYIWPSPPPESPESPPRHPIPELDENHQSCFTFNRLCGEYLRSIEGNAVLEDGDDLLFYGRRTMVVKNLKEDLPPYRGRVSIENRTCRAVTSRIKVRLPDNTIATFEVFRC